MRRHIRLYIILQRLHHRTVGMFCRGSGGSRGWPPWKPGWLCPGPDLHYLVVFAVNSGMLVLSVPGGVACSGPALDLGPAHTGHRPFIHRTGGAGPDYNLIYWAKLSGRDYGPLGVPALPRETGSFFKWPQDPPLKCVTLEGPATPGQQALWSTLHAPDYLPYWANS